MSAETSLRISGDTSLSTALSAETSLRISGDTSLSIQLSAETSLRISGNTSLSTALSAETSLRISGDTSLSTALSAETSLRISGDTSLSIQLSAETSSRISAIANIQWKSPVSTASLLPNSNNSIGDVRIALDTNVTYIAISSTSWIKQGSPSSLTSFQGNWNANTNSPTIVSGSGGLGFWYLVSVSGLTTIDGISSWKIGDYIWFSSDTNTWQKIDNQNTTVAPGGLNTQIQFNNSGNFSGNSGLTFNQNNNTLSIINNMSTGTTQSCLILSNNTITTSGSTIQSPKVISMLGNVFTQSGSTNNTPYGFRIGDIGTTSGAVSPTSSFKIQTSKDQLNWIDLYSHTYQFNNSQMAVSIGGGSTAGGVSLTLNGAGTSYGWVLATGTGIF